jgi:hypothetical protein
VGQHCASRQIRTADVRFGSKADIAARPSDVRFTPKSGHGLSALGCPLCAKSGHGAAFRSSRRRSVISDGTMVIDLRGFRRCCKRKRDSQTLRRTGFDCVAKLLALNQDRAPSISAASLPFTAPPTCSRVVDCYGRHPHHQGGSDQYRLERGFTGCHDHPSIVARKTFIPDYAMPGAAKLRSRGARCRGKRRFK